MAQLLSTIGWGLCLLKTACTSLTRLKATSSIPIIKLQRVSTMEDTWITLSIRQDMIASISWFRLRSQREGSSMRSGERKSLWILLMSIVDKYYPKFWKLCLKLGNYSPISLAIFQLTALNPRNTRCSYSSCTISWSHLHPPKFLSFLSTKCSRVFSTTSTLHLEETLPNRQSCARRGGKLLLIWPKSSRQVPVQSGIGENYILTMPNTPLSERTPFSVNFSTLLSRGWETCTLPIWGEWRCSNSAIFRHRFEQVRAQFWDMALDMKIGSFWTQV